MRNIFQLPRMYKEKNARAAYTSAGEMSKRTAPACLILPLPEKRIETHPYISKSVIYIGAGSELKSVAFYLTAQMFEGRALNALYLRFSQICHAMAYGGINRNSNRVG